MQQLIAVRRDAAHTAACKMHKAASTGPPVNAPIGAKPTKYMRGTHFQKIPSYRTPRTSAAIFGLAG
jgi:hypothetical protein